MYYCGFCDYASYKSTNLKNHEAIHLGYRPFKCEVCSKAFVQKIHLRRHLLTHSLRRELSGKISRKLHCCSFCDYTTHQSTHMKNHEAIHLGCKPYKCQMCSKAFIQKVNLQRHLLTHMAI
ncbi:zinc finger protein [Trichonephila clavipes]|nr:zinc finger protein [Trichonephila clavipes]